MSVKNVTKPTPRLCSEKHKESAHENKRYICYQCHNKFTRKSGLKLHIQSVHKGVYFECQTCSKKFTDPINLTKHIRSKHEEIIYPFDKCDIKFSTRHGAWLHRKKSCKLLNKL